MTIGAGTFTPQGQFWFPRSYVYGITIATYVGQTITQGSFSFTIHAPPPDNTFLRCNLDPRFYVWSSNSWSLDHIVTDFWYKLDGIGSEIPHDYDLRWVFNATRHRNELLLQWTPLTPTFNAFNLPAQPLNYWLPKPLP